MTKARVLAYLGHPLSRITAAEFTALQDWQTKAEEATSRGHKPPGFPRKKAARRKATR